MPDNFSGQFCRQFQVSPDDFRAAMLRRTLYPSARLLSPVLRLIDRNYFSAEHEYIDGVARIQRARDLSMESYEFNHHPANRRFIRRTLRLRVSVGRMRALVHRVLDAPTPTAS